MSVLIELNCDSYADTLCLVVDVIVQDSESDINHCRMTRH